MSNTKIFFLENTCNLEIRNRQKRQECEKLWMKYLWEYTTKERKKYSYYSKSHAGGKPLLAMSTELVGCDLEWIRWDWTIQELKKRMCFYLTQEEMESVLLSKEPRHTAILAWTRKESYFKVHHKRQVSDEFSLVESKHLVQGTDMEFVSRTMGNDGIATCYHRKNNPLEWMSVSL